MLPLDDTGGGHFDGAVGLGLDGTLAIDGLAQGVDNTADERLTNGHGYHPAGALNGVTLLDALIGAKDGDGDGVLLQVLGHAEGAVGEFYQLAGHALVQAGGLGNAVADHDDRAGFAGLHFVLVVFDLTTNDFCDFFGSQFHTVPAFSSEYGFTQQFPHRVQVMGHGVVQTLTVIVQADAAQNSGLHPVVQNDLLAGTPA